MSDDLSNSDRDAMRAAEEDRVNAYGCAMTKRDQIAAPSSAVWEQFGGYSTGYKAGVSHFNPNRVGRFKGGM